MNAHLPRPHRLAAIGLWLTAAGSLAWGQGTDSLAAAKALQDSFLLAKSKVIRALVNVRPVTEVFEDGVKTQQECVGSGVLFSSRGYIITNYHVAGKARRVICTLYDKARVEAKLVGGDALTDIAVLQIPEAAVKANQLIPAKLGDSAKLEMGHLVFAFGSPMALSRSMSYGIVSNPRRYLSTKARLPTGERTGTFNTWIQTDAAINPGNSGGPLVDISGEVVGINARIIGFADGLGFAIPINIVKDVVGELVAHGKVMRSWLGVEFQPMEEIGAERGKHGVLISNVAPGSPASQAGLRVGDILVSYAGRAVSARFIEDIPSIAKLVADTPVGQKVAVEIVRGGKPLTIQVTTAVLGQEVGGDMECKAWGITVRGITEQMALDRRLDDAQGVIVTGAKRGSYAEMAGVKEGDVLRDVGARPIESMADFQLAYAQVVAKETPAVFVKLHRRNAVKYAVIKAKYDATKK